MFGRVGHNAAIGPGVVPGSVAEGVVMGVFVAHPAPARKGFGRNAAALIELGKGLQTGEVGPEGKSAVADGQGRVHVEVANDRVVPGDQRLAVNGSRRGVNHGRERCGEPTNSKMSKECFQK